MFERLYGVVFFSVGIPSSDLPNVISKTYVTYDALYRTLPSGLVGCTGLQRMWVFKCISSKVARFCLDVTRWSVLAGSCRRAGCFIDLNRTKTMRVYLRSLHLEHDYLLVQSHEWNARVH